jgi:hypothetical protein
VLLFLAFFNQPHYTTVVVEGKIIGVLLALWDQFLDPDDPVTPYTPYSFLPTGKTGIPKMSMTRDWGRRESVVSIPGLDSVLDQYGRQPGPMDRRDVTFAFRVIVGPGGDLDAAYDLLAAQVAPGYPQRLVYQTDSGGLWFTVGSNPRIQHTLVADNRAMTAYVDFTVTWRIRPDWRLRYSQASDVWGVNDGIWGVNDGIWGALHSIALPTNPTLFSVDATGTAGTNLPTIPDTGPVVTITGPFGGDGGIILLNSSAPLRDPAGNASSVQLTLPYKLRNFSESIILDCAARRFLHNGVPFRPVKFTWQRVFFQITAGKVNNLGLYCVGANPLSGASVSSVAMTNGGSGYPTTPGAVTATFAAPPAGGTTATGLPILDVGGHITGVVVTDPGNGYILASPPAVTFSAASGSGAVAVASLTNASVTVDWWKKRA